MQRLNSNSCRGKLTVMQPVGISAVIIRLSEESVLNRKAKREPALFITTHVTQRTFLLSTFSRFIFKPVSLQLHNLQKLAVYYLNLWKQRRKLTNRLLVLNCVSVATNSSKIAELCDSWICFHSWNQIQSYNQHWIPAHSSSTWIFLSKASVMIDGS